MKINKITEKIRKDGGRDDKSNILYIIIGVIFRSRVCRVVLCLDCELKED